MKDKATHFVPVAATQPVCGRVRLPAEVLKYTTKKSAVTCAKCVKKMTEEMSKANERMAIK